MIDRAQALLQRQILSHEGLGLSEVRVISKGRSVYCSTDEQYLKALEDNSDANLYVGVNPRREEKGDITSVNHLTCLVIDIDPVRPKGHASTEEQHQAAIAAGTAIHKDLKGSLLVDSGSGCHIYFPLKEAQVTNGEVLTESLKEWAEGFKTRYPLPPTLRIDSTYDLPRVIRVWGSHNYKSDRTCKLISEYSEYNDRFKFDFNQKEVAKIQKEVEETNESTLERRFQRLANSNPTMGKLLSGTAHYESRSEADYAFISVLAKAGFSYAEIKELFVRNVQGNGQTDKNNDRYVKLTYGNVNHNETSYSLTTKAKDYFGSLTKRKEGILTGIRGLDELMCGLKAGKLYMFAAYPGEGKTTIGTQIAENVAAQDIGVGIAPTEIGAEQVFDKIVSKNSRVNLKKFQSGKFEPGDLEKIEKVKDYVTKLPITVCEDFALTAGKVEKHIRDTGCGLMIVDYIQAMYYEEGDHVEIARNVDAFKRMALEYGIPFILMSQLRRPTGDSKLNLHQMQGSSKLEQRGDVISFLIPKPNCTDYPVPYDLVVMKSKYAGTGTVPLLFEKSICNFKEAPYASNP